MEINETLVEATKKRCPGTTVYQSSASNAKRHLEIHGEQGCDRIISSLPWSTFSDELQDDLMETIIDILNPGGKFLTYAYIPGLVFPSARRFKNKLHEKFDKVGRSKTVWTNFPPAFVYYAEKT
jgi:phospholipid N-methyltransferase